MVSELAASGGMACRPASGGLLGISEAAELLDRLPAPRLRECDGLGDLRRNVGFDERHIVRMDHAAALQPSLEAHDGIPVPPAFDLDLVTIELSVEHRMGAQPIGPAFQEIGPAALAHRMNR